MTDDLTCPVPGCPRVRQRTHMMCRTCWRRVTHPTQTQVYAAFRAYSKAATSGAENFGAAHDAYYDIREQAIREAEA